MNEIKYELQNIRYIIIFCTFFVCKVAGFIDWSWWWIFSPLLIGIITEWCGRKNDKRIKKIMDKI